MPGLSPDAALGEIISELRLQKAFQQVPDNPEAEQALQRPVLKPLLDEAAGQSGRYSSWRPRDHLDARGPSPGVPRPERSLCWRRPELARRMPGAAQRVGDWSWRPPRSEMTLELDDIQSGAVFPRPSPSVGTYVLLRIDHRARRSARSCGG